MDLHDNREYARAIQLEREAGYRKAQLVGRVHSEPARGNWKALIALLFGSTSTSTPRPTSISKPRPPLQTPSTEV